MTAPQTCAACDRSLATDAFSTYTRTGNDDNDVHLCSKCASDARRAWLAGKEIHEWIAEVREGPAA